MPVARLRAASPGENETVMMPGVIGLFAVLGAPLFAVFGAWALVAFRGMDVDLSVVVQEFAKLATEPLLQTLPMFALAGYLLAESGAPRRLLRVSRAAFGWVLGGQAAVAAATLSLLTAFTGASGVTIVALGGLLLPALREEGYTPRYSLGLVTSGGNIGVLFAPSLPIILYSVIASSVYANLENVRGHAVTIDHLFRAALLPGLLTLAALAVHGAFAARRQGLARRAFAWRELGAALWEAKWELPLPFVVLGGIYSGKIAVSEAAVLTAAYALVVETLITREIRFRALAALIRESMILVGGMLLILGLGKALTLYFTFAEIPARILDVVQAKIHSPWAFLLALNGLLLVVGCLMDIYTAIIVVVPLIIPAAHAFGIDPTHLGVIFLTNLAIGYSTPPVGMNLFIASLRFREPLMSLTRASLPFLALLLVILAAVTYWPPLSLAWLGSAP